VNRPEPYVTALGNSEPSTSQNALALAATQIAPSNTTPVSGVISSTATRSDVQEISEVASTEPSTASAVATLPSWRSAKSQAQTWAMTDSGRSSSASSVPVRTS
jgi:hypothetical protein